MEKEDKTDIPPSFIYTAKTSEVIYTDHPLYDSLDSWRRTDVDQRNIKLTLIGSWAVKQTGGLSEVHFPHYEVRPWADELRPILLKDRNDVQLRQMKVKVRGFLRRLGKRIKSYDRLNKFSLTLSDITQDMGRSRIVHTINLRQLLSKLQRGDEDYDDGLFRVCDLDKSDSDDLCYPLDTLDELGYYIDPNKNGPRLYRALTEDIKLALNKCPTLEQESLTISHLEADPCIDNDLDNDMVIGPFEPLPKRRKIASSTSPELTGENGLEESARRLNNLNEDILPLPPVDDMAYKIKSLEDKKGLDEQFGQSFKVIEEGVYAWGKHEKPDPDLY
ncbi:hypothetical protein B0T17DRAFT_615734 [Bombardia bombarda]|uniref:Uncharacterized protein n=1 Tax=Bombardia bombarda TaxID=252184 RepID=A0AA39X9X0_9PEZI|nr:hypothetical protein B0T17DRAFT_615734 [Bombardia bombarda]